MDSSSASRYIYRDFIGDLIKTLATNRKQKKNKIESTDQPESHAQERLPVSIMMSKSQRNSILEIFPINSRKSNSLNGTRRLTFPESRIPEQIPTPRMLEKSIKETTPRNDKWVEHPLSKGCDFRLFSATFNRDNEKEKLRKKTEQAVQKPTIRSPFFPKMFHRAPLSQIAGSSNSSNFQQSPRSTSAIQYLPVDGFRLGSEMSSSNLDLSILDENGDIDLDDLSPTHLLVVFFNDMCPIQLFNSQGCSDQEECVHFTHTLPDDKHLARLLRRNNYQDATDVYSFVMNEFPCDVRDRLLPTFVDFFAEKRVCSMLKTMIRDHQKSSPDFDFSAIVNGMQRNGWDRVDAIKFVIDNHDSQENAKQALKAILCLIGKMGVEVYKFSSYLTKCKSK